MNKDLAKIAVKKFGVGHQADMVTEECAELIQVIRHLYRNRCTMEDVIAEMVDVEITMRAMQEGFKITDAQMDVVREKKLAKYRKALGV